MRVRLKGINKVTKRLADGRKVTYWYAWKGGPSLPGKLGSPEFVAAYNEAIAHKARTPKAILLRVIHAYKKSQQYLRLAKATLSNRERRLRDIENRFGDFPLSALADKRTRGIFLEWRDDIASRSVAEADIYFAALARMLAWGLDRGLVDANPCANTPKLYHGTRITQVWSFDQEAAFYQATRDNMRDAQLLGTWTGQRESDLVNLEWTAYDGRCIRLQQQKRPGPDKPYKRVVIPVGAPLKARLDSLKKERGIETDADHKQKILLNGLNLPWANARSFCSAFHKACVKAGIVGRTFHDLRGTAVTRLAIAEATEAQIAAITGHSLRDVKSILEAHYLYLDPALAEAAIKKLEALMMRPTERPTEQQHTEFVET